MKRKITTTQLQNWAKKGNQIAFKYKRNARRYQSILRRKGYSTGTLRSHGPTVEGGSSKSYYVIGLKKKKRSR